MELEKCRRVRSINQRPEHGTQSGHAGWVEIQHKSRFHTNDSSKHAIVFAAVHVTQLHEILRDADVASATFTVLHEYRLTEEQTKHALVALHVPRAANVAGITQRGFPIHPLLCNYQGKLWSQVARLTT